ncbi:Reverse transcriptase (RNA-dependent DNA polymerase) [Ruminococcaceae bacterium YRB3002]|nr:Reverse transcriptase (RNA-dependent DNA polymerase) [Ruminococcaceae bacterium YRB3002]
MSLIDLIDDRREWEKYYAYKTSLTANRKFAVILREFIDSGRYHDVWSRISEGEDLPLPRRAVISKMSSRKSRVVYTYPSDENIVLKFLTYLILRRYDNLFCPCLYSFRPHHTVKDAVRTIVKTPGIDGMHAYKVDISNYFNSIPVERLLPELEDVLADDRPLFDLLSRLLKEPFVLDRGTLLEESKGIMAGTPQACFYANLYLRGLDQFFCDTGIPYARYSDDIIVFAQTREQLDTYVDHIREYLASRGLSVNPDKEEFFAPEDGWVFLGFSYCRGVVDIAPASVTKIKAKMRRKARALSRWSARKDKPSERAAAAFIRVFNSKLYEADEETPDNELTWSKWYFPVINTDKSLRVIDHYAQDCVRYLMSGKHNKARFRIGYEDMKALGLRSLVHSFYEDSEE